jgi:hypothetical protein
MEGRVTTVSPPWELGTRVVADTPPGRVVVVSAATGFGEEFLLASSRTTPTAATTTTTIPITTKVVDFVRLVATVSENLL